jgi:folate-binding Fe-S cluster repair protein YgfZ
LLLQCGRLTIGNAKVGTHLEQQQQPVWSEVGVSDANQMKNASCSKRPQSQLSQNQLQQFWHVDLLNAQNHLQQSMWLRDAVTGGMAPHVRRDEQHSFVGPGTVPLLAFDRMNSGNYF